MRAGRLCLLTAFNQKSFLKNQIIDVILKVDLKSSEL